MFSKNPTAIRSNVENHLQQMVCTLNMGGDHQGSCMKGLAKGILHLHAAQLGGISGSSTAKWRALHSRGHKPEGEDSRQVNTLV